MTYYCQVLDGQVSGAPAGGGGEMNQSPTVPINNNNKIRREHSCMSWALCLGLPRRHRLI